MFAGFSSFASAQTNRGSISGSVSDPTGATIANVRVVARNAATGLTAEAAATDDGVFRFSELQPSAFIH
ncbi:MAG: carboxypeptidase-like regulatory domain-containing protein [Pyrinomonadaceae bacterium]